MNELAEIFESKMSPMDRIDHIEARVIGLLGIKPAGVGETPEIVPVRHTFTPGLYIRECFMSKGSVVVSKIHNTKHPFTVLSGHCLVYTEDDKWTDIKAPHFGITKPGRRRVLFVKENTHWITYHVTDKTNVADIERDIITPHENPLLKEITQ